MTAGRAGARYTCPAGVGFRAGVTHKARRRLAEDQPLATNLPALTTYLRECDTGRILVVAAAPGELRRSGR